MSRNNSGPRHRRLIEPFRSPRSRRLLWAFLVSELGDGVSFTVIPLGVYAVSGSVTALAGTFLGRLLLASAFAAAGGWAADRVDRRTLLLASYVVRALIVAALIAVPREAVGIYAALGILVGAGGSFDNPAAEAGLRTVYRHDLQALAAARKTGKACSGLIGPAVGGLLFGLGGMPLALSINVAAFVISIGILWPDRQNFNALPAESNDDAAALTSRTATSRLLAPLDVRLALLSSTCASFLVGIAVVIVVPYFHALGTAPPGAYGYALSAYSVGGLVGLWLAGIADWSSWRLRSVLIAAHAIYGVLVVISVAQPSWWFVAGAWLAWGIAFGPEDVLGDARAARVTPPELLGGLYAWWSVSGKAGSAAAFGLSMFIAVDDSRWALAIVGIGYAILVPMVLAFVRGAGTASPRSPRRSPAYSRGMSLPKIVLFYVFTPLADPEAVRLWQLNLAQRTGVTGRIIVSEQGINATVGGDIDQVKQYVKGTREYAPFHGADVKWSDGIGHDFPRLSVKRRPELVSFHAPDTIEVRESGVVGGGTHLSPRQLHELVEQRGDDVVFFDGRNALEAQIGRFRNAVVPHTRTTADFVAELDSGAYDHLKDRPVVTYCTGGVRCEVLSVLMRHRGFRDVYQLEGGIVHYGETYGNRGLWDGSLYVFDRRMHVDFAPDTVSLGRCEACAEPTPRFVNCAEPTCRDLFLCCPACTGAGRSLCPACHACHALDDAAAAPGHATSSARVVTLRTGAVATRTWGERTLRTAAVKTPHETPVWLTILGFRGDEQGNLSVHGGPDKAVCCYPAEHYARWRADGVELPDGAFFENLTISGATEERVFLGDVFRLGEAVVQVTQPRTPCTTVSARWQRTDLPTLMMESSRCGYYLRVLREGAVAPGDRLEFVRRLPGAVSVAHVNHTMNVDRGNLEALRGLLQVPEFPDRWRTKIARRLEVAS